ncbi:RNA degradosome polyphosphate kinase [Lacticaseibacillus pabuli]|uniref:Polyphosphate kinase n=1 Tax=Lacticaseibacillus pabuli TaxID=3025672 RepID=A0ABY7WTH3_9LACO|nr:RNA degradosome polyphosphate kinase [Lacticaseibacillus sp. KACC 23028]WDF82297.1 RNA degradosome polyphosphate kinase [Lacticaseibacillus sp. KACC 23028]
MSKRTYTNTKYFTNRELSWVAFDDRVLEEARDKHNPLLERVKFLAITQSNLDEFFNVRVASLRKMVTVGYDKADAAGMTPEMQLKAISTDVHELVDKQYRTLTRSLIPQLAAKEVHLLTAGELNDEQLDFIDDYFHRELYPILTPLAVDASRPFPFLANNSLNIAVRLQRGDTEGKGKNRSFATVQVPSGVPRVVRLPGNNLDFILIEEIIRHFIAELFVGASIRETAMFRVTRDMGLDVDEEDADNLMLEIQEQLKKRERGRVMRLEIDASMTKSLEKYLVKQMKLDDENVYAINGPIDLTFLKQLVKGIGDRIGELYPDATPYLPKMYKQKNIFDIIREQDMFLNLPYDSFSPVVDFIHQAAIDPQVLAVKMTLYRVSSKSPIIQYLKQAATNGKQVTVLVELKARFDEENNVHWAKELEQAGCHVIYGLVGLKTHCKLALVVRREEDGMRRYMHMATGNYNDVTARFYTDMGLFTANPEIGTDASNIFNMLSGFSEPPYFHKLVISPMHIREFLSDRIDDEIEAAKAGRKALIKMKMNSLSDPHMIRKLYEASAAGVKINLIVRGICNLKVGIPGVSDNIEVHSLVGRFLEHSRIYYFYNDGDEQLFLSSADLMTRNLSRRVEILFPILQDNIRKQIINIFKIQWEDNAKTRILQPDASWEHVDRRGRTPLNAQEFFLANAKRMAEELIDYGDDEILSKNHQQSGPGHFTPLRAPEDPDEED